jgi:hypothetical protein
MYGGDALDVIPRAERKHQARQVGCYGTTLAAAKALAPACGQRIWR